MKVVILAGGMGTCLSEETTFRPKPLVEIGGMPILWHIMKLRTAHGFTDFIVCLGYKGYMIKEYFANYYLHNSDETFFEQEPMKQLTSEGQLSAMFHHGFWQCMDTLRDKQYLEELWASGKAPWKCW